ncbi:uncharacterized protein LOC115236888 isoform X1 [Formica exsecta]|uniref:uncharacterized protein LOC115236888 isoform X1 n=2 Tax=Formica exsecta TaxID=72781 RepID=UPI0011425263|nr:uncharacterized protein LOC115236888 isoform X1 [Formica exsecta]
MLCNIMCLWQHFSPCQLRATHVPTMFISAFFNVAKIKNPTTTTNMEFERKKRKEYVKYAKVFPLSGTLDFKVPSKWYRRVVGSLEIICGLAMAIIPSHKVKNLSNTVLLLLMLMAVYSHYMVNDKFERIAPALVSNRLNFTNHKLVKSKMWFQVFFFMLTGRLVIDWQLRREDTQSVTANGVDDKAKKQD